jgi:hypothetical protein
MLVRGDTNQGKGKKFSAKVRLFTHLRKGCINVGSWRHEPRQGEREVILAALEAAYQDVLTKKK